MLPGIAQEADLVLHLDHQDRPRVAVLFPEVAHQGGESAAIGLQRLPVEGGQDFGVGSVAVFRQREPISEVLFHPGGHVAGHTVLPGSEPEQDQMQVVGPGRCEQVIHRREVELSLRRFQQFPVHRREDRIQARLPEGLPSVAAVHIGRAGGAGIRQLAAQDEERLSVEEEPAARQPDRRGGRRQDQRNVFKKR